MSAKEQVKKVVDYFLKEPRLEEKTEAMGEGLMLGANLADEANERSLGAHEDVIKLQQEYTENGNGSQSTAEITLSRDGEPTLRDRLNRDNQEITAQLAHMMNYIIPEDFGAIGNGVVNDAIPIRDAFQASYELKIPVYINKHYKIATPIPLPDELIIIGDSRLQEYHYPMERKVKSLFITECDPVFLGGTPENLAIKKITMYGVGFSDRLEGATLFENVDITLGSNIEQNGFRSYGTVIRGVVSLLSYIDKNKFIDIRKSVLSNRGLENTSGITDSFIRGNYLNGSLYSQEVNLLDLHFPNVSTISDNFIDFASLSGIYITNGHSVTLNNNLIDYCYRGMRLDKLTDSNISLNKFFHHKTSYYAKWFAPRDEMSSNPWVGIELGSQLKGLSIVDSTTREVDKLITFNNYGYQDINTRGNKGIIEMKRYKSAISGDGSDLSIAELQDMRVSTLPNPSLTGTGISTFNGQRIYYNSKLLINENGAWKDMLGNIVTA